MCKKYVFFTYFCSNTEFYGISKFIIIRRDKFYSKYVPRGDLLNTKRNSNLFFNAFFIDIS